VLGLCEKEHSIKTKIRMKTIFRWSALDNRISFSGILFFSLFHIAVVDVEASSRFRRPAEPFERTYSEPRLSKEAREKLREALGLDAPKPSQADEFIKTFRENYGAGNPPPHLRLTDDPNRKSVIRDAFAKQFAGFGKPAVTELESGILVASDFPSYLNTWRELQSNPMNDKVLFLNRSGNAQGLQELSAEPKSLEVLHQIPLKEEHVRSIHGSAPPNWQAQMAAAHTQMKKALARYASHKKVSQTDLGTVANVKSTILDAVGGQKPGDLLVIIAHCAGGFLHFYDGSKLSFKELNGNGKTLVFACNTFEHSNRDVGLGYGTLRPITYQEANVMTELILQTVSTRSSYFDFFMRLQKSEVFQNHLSSRLRRGSGPKRLHQSILPSIPRGVPLVMYEDRNVIVVQIA
jgi:hypothetical protein